jgi:hypothetical protein
MIRGITTMNENTWVRAPSRPHLYIKQAGETPAHPGIFIRETKSGLSV